MVGLHANAVTEKGAAGEGARGIDSEDSDLVFFGSQGSD